jgi:hypothetical protein
MDRIYPVLSYEENERSRMDGRWRVTSSPVEKTGVPMSNIQLLSCSLQMASAAAERSHMVSLLGVGRLR